MSTDVFPTLPGVGWPARRTAMMSSDIQENTSGKRVYGSYWSSPRWQWELTIPDVLRQGTRNGSVYTEFATLVGFFNKRRGKTDSFLFQDADDHTVTAQVFATGNGVANTFQLARTFGGFVEPIFAPNPTGGVTNLKVNGVLKTFGVDWTVSLWGSASPGIVTFLTGAPGNGLSISADLNYYWPVTFQDDTMDFQRFMNTLYAAQSIKFESVK